MRIQTLSRPAAGIRRCGVRHVPEPTVWPAGTFTEEQLETLLLDPDVVVEFVDDEEDEPAAQDAGAGAPVLPLASWSKPSSAASDAGAAPTMAQVVAPLTPAGEVPSGDEPRQDPEPAASSAGEPEQTPEPEAEQTPQSTAAGVGRKKSRR